MISCPRASRLAALVGLGLVMLLGPLAGAAAAHVSLTDSKPAYGDKLSAAPTEFVLNYDSSFEVSLANASLDTGTSSTDAKPFADLDHSGPANGYATSVTFKAPATLPDGSYRLRWTLYSLDGHTMSGVIPFTVGAAVVPPTTAPTAPSSVQTPPTGPAPATGAPTKASPHLTSNALAIAKALAKLALYVALALVAGGLFWTHVPVHRLFIQDVRSTASAVMRRALGVCGAAAGLLALINLVNAFRAGVTHPRQLALVASGDQVWPWLLVAAASVLTQRLVRLSREDDSSLPRLQGAVPSAAVVLIAALTLAGAGHATETRWSVLTIVFLTLHIAAMTAWMGPVLMLTWLRYSAVGARAHFVKAILPGLRRFTPIALCAAAVIAASGLRVMWSIGGSSVPGGRYGWILVLKVAVAVATVVPAGACHMFAVRRAERGGGTAAMRTTLLAESAGFVAVAVLAAVLSATAHS